MEKKGDIFTAFAALLLVCQAFAYSPFYIGAYSTADVGSAGLSGHYAYVGFTRTTLGLKILDISLKRPWAPVDSVPALVNIRRIAVEGQDAFFYRPDAGRLYLYDVSDPLKPVPMDSVTFAINIDDMAIYGNYLLIGNSTQGIISLNFSVPSAMVFSDTLNIPGAFSMTLSGPLAYVSAGTAGLKIVDISDAADLKFVGGISLFPRTAPIVLDRRLYCITTDYHGHDSLCSFNVEDPANPVLISRQWTSSDILSGYKDRVFVEMNNNTIVAKAPASFENLFQYPCSAFRVGAVQDSIACFIPVSSTGPFGGVNGYGLSVINMNGAYQPVSVPADPLDYLIIYPEAWSDAVSPYADFKNLADIRTEMIAMERLPGYSGTPADTAVIRDYIHAAYFERGLKYVLLVGDVDKIPTVQMPSPAPASGGYYHIYDDYNHLPYGTDFFYFDPFAGRVEGTKGGRDIMGARLPVDLKSQAARYLKLWMDYTGKIQAPFRVTFFADNAWDIKSNTYSRAWLADSWNGVADAMVDSFFSATITKQDIYDGFAGGSLFINYLGHGNDWRWTAPNFTLDDALEIKNLDNPCFMVTQACRTADLDKADCLIERFFEADSSAFLGIIAPTNSPMNYDWDIYGPYFWKSCADQYKESGRVFPCSIFGDFNGDFLNWGYFGDPTIVMDKNLPNMGSKTSLGAGVSSVALSCAPNPSNPGTKISFVLPKGASVMLSVYDISGRKVRDILSGAMKQGVHSAIFDGKDEQGGALGSGVYLVRLATSGKIFNYRAMLVR